MFLFVFVFFFNSMIAIKKRMKSLLNVLKKS